MSLIFLKQKFPMLAFKSKYSDGNELNKNSIILLKNSSILLIARSAIAVLVFLVALPKCGKMKAVDWFK